MEPSLRTIKACDACKRRKVKCNGKQRCQQCTHLDLECLYSTATPSSRSRKAIVRGRVIEECKGPGISSGRRTPTSLLPAPLEASSTSRGGSDLSGTSVFDPAFFIDLIPDYVSSILPVLPIFGESEFRSAIDRMETSEEDRAFLYVLGAITMSMTRLGPRHPQENINRVRALYRLALKIRGPLIPHDPVTTRSIMIPLVTSICELTNHHDVDMGFFYLREAITRIQILRVYDPERMARLDVRVRAQQERMYWLLFVHERYFSIYHRQPIVLPALQDLPGDDPSMRPEVIEGFRQIIRLFSIIDKDFTEFWVDRQRPSMTFAWVEKKQAELGGDIEVWGNEISSLTDMQQIDLVVTRYWLHTLLWQLTLSKLLLTSSVDGEREFMSFMFPIRLSRGLRSSLATMPREAVEIHGTGILQKIFDVTDTIADILVHVPAATNNSKTESDHLDDFLFLYRFLLSMSRFYHVEESVLRAKFQTLRTLFPSFCNAGE
jgi:hypothetical protein